MYIVNSRATIKKTKNRRVMDMLRNEEKMQS